MLFLEGFDGSALAIVISNARIRLSFFGPFKNRFFHFSSRKRLSLLSGSPLGPALAADPALGVVLSFLLQDSHKK